MVFTKDSTFLNLVRGERDYENYGISHTIRHWFVDEKERDMLLRYYINLIVDHAYEPNLKEFYHSATNH